MSSLLKVILRYPTFQPWGDYIKKTPLLDHTFRRVTLGA